VLLCIAAANLWVLSAQQRRLRHLHLADSEWPPVSILIPARDEERNIETCVRSLLAQNYPDFEVVVLDDHSHDQTAAILSRLSAGDLRLRILAGADLPAGWPGKHWACHQLGASARHSILLFTDADTRHEPDSVRSGVAALIAHNSGAVTALPRQIIATPGEQWVVPILYWAFMAFVPLFLAYRLPIQALSFGIGQYLMFRRIAYDEIGGFEAVRNSAVDDLALMRRLQAARIRWTLLDGTWMLACRMYTGFGEAVDGLSKNLFAAFDYRIAPFIFVWTWVGIVFLQPFVALVLFSRTSPLNSAGVLWAAVAILLAFILWLTVYIRFRFKPLAALAYPLNILSGVFIAYRSMFFSLTGRASWKGRPLDRSKVRWI
jgi:chlorobactene glucosyltransferase